MKKCILNFASANRSNYIKGQKRLFNSLKSNGFDGDIILWNSEKEFDCPSHKSVPMPLSLTL